MMRALALAPLLLLPAGCEKTEAERPTPPDLSALAAAYEAPTGTLTAESGRALVEALPALLQEVADVGALVAVATGTVSGFGGISAPPAEGSLRVDALATESAGWTLSAEAGGWAELRRRCPGWGDDGDRGVLTLRALIDADGLSDTIWGEIAGCRAADADGTRFRYDGTVALLAPDLGQSDLLVQVVGTVDTSEAVRDFDVDLRFAEGLLLLRHAVDGGAQFVVGVDTGEGDALYIRDAAGQWSCDAAGCEGPGGTLSW